MPAKSTGTARKRPLSHYMRLNKGKADYCKGKTTKAAVKKLATAYERDAVKKGNHTAASAKVVSGKVLRRGCAMTASIGKKKKTHARKKVSGTLKMTHMAGKRRKTTRRRK